MLGRAWGAVLSAAALGCASNDARPPTPPDCTEPGCNPGPTGGGPGGGTGGARDGGGGSNDANVPPAVDATADAGTVTVNYTVRQTVDSWFYATAVYVNAVTVRAVGPNGQVAPASDAGTAVPQTVTDVASGANWFLVEDATSSRRLTGTLQLVDIDPRTPSATLRGVATDDISNLVVDQVVWAPPAGTATIILSFRRAGRGVAGVTVDRSALPAGTTVAYDSSGMYVSDGMVIGTLPATDVQGTAIVREIAGAQPFPALNSATLRYRLTNNTSTFPAIEAKIARDAVTWMQIDLL